LKIRLRSAVIERAPNPRNGAATVEQNRYQIRFEWAASGAQVLAEAGDIDVFVWVDAIRPASAGSAALIPDQGAVIEGSLAASAAIAQWIVALQRELARRVVVAIIAAGERREDGATRFAVEDFLAAGAIIDQLNKLGLDATSPEAAVAEAAFLQLKPAVGHLVSASVSAKAIASLASATVSAAVSEAVSGASAPPASASPASGSPASGSAPASARTPLAGFEARVNLELAAEDVVVLRAHSSDSRV
jgi:hypothetical protein